MSAAVATQFVRRMAELETKGFGDDDNALRRIEAKSGISFWTLKYLKQGRAATVDADILSRIRGYYLTYCEQKVSALQRDIEREKAISTDDDLDVLEAEAAALAAKIAARKEHQRGRK